MGLPNNKADSCTSFVIVISDNLDFSANFAFDNPNDCLRFGFKQI